MKLKLFINLILLGGLLAPAIAGAVNLDNLRNFANNAGIPPYDSFEKVLLVVLDALLAVSFIIAVIFVVLSGFRMVTSGGNEKQLEGAKQNLLWALIGIVVIVLAYVILQLVVEVVKTGNVGNTTFITQRNLTG